MAIEFKLPELGENIETCDVVEVLVSEGDEVQEGHPLLEIETDKAAVEVPSDVSGVVAKIHIKAGDTIEVGQTLFTFEGEGASAAQEATPTEDAKETPTTEPEKAPSRAAKKMPAIVAAQTAAAPPASEGPREPLQRQGLGIRDQGLGNEERSSGDSALTPNPQPLTPASSVPAAPSVRQFAREIGIDISQVPGTGPGGRISIDDVKNYARQRQAERPAKPTEKPTVGVTLPDFSKWGEVEREAMSNIRRATATHLSTAWNTIPHVTNFDKADITELEKLRKTFQPKAEAAGGKLTITAILLKVVVGALKAFPKFNASVAMDSHEIIYKKYYHVGVAVDTPAGLFVPVIRNAERKSVIELAVELGEVAAKARDRKLGLDDMQGGTFTITNLGGIGGTNFTPIINAPEVAILGVARGQYEPVYIDGEFQPRLMLPLALSYDHRVIDGADAARFLRWLVETLEQPFLIALQG